MSAIHPMCRVTTLCVAVPIWGVCRDSYTLKYLSLQVGHKARQSTNSIRSDEFKYWVGAEPLEDIEGDY